MLMQLCRDHKSVPEHLSVLKQRSLPVGQDDFMAVAKDYNEIFVLVDALDECNRENRPNILGFLNDILHSHSKAHVCVMSRPENDITRALERDDTFVIRLQEHDLKPDIETYVKDEVTALREGRNGVQLFLKREELVSEIIQTLSEQAAGM